MGAEGKHIERLNNYHDYHEDGACLVSHSEGRKKHCNYERNGYDITLNNRKKYYNYPDRYDPYKVKGFAFKFKHITFRDKKIKEKILKVLRRDATTKQQDLETFDPFIWNIGHEDNFVPGKGAHNPYEHNWHHMIPNATLFEKLYDETDETDEYRLLELLMRGKYNLNHGRNVVLIPQDPRVGEIIDWPIHPNNHPGYDEFASNELETLKDRLMELLENKEVHQVDQENVENIAEDVHKISDRLFDILERMPGGTHINEIENYAEDPLAELKNLFKNL